MIFGLCRSCSSTSRPRQRSSGLYEAARLLAPVTACTTNADYIKLPRFQYQPALVNYAPALPDAVRGSV